MKLLSGMFFVENTRCLENWWLKDDPFLLALGLFSGAKILVLARVYKRRYDNFHIIWITQCFPSTVVLSEQHSHHVKLKIMKPQCETNTQLEKCAEYETRYVQGSKLPIGDGPPHL